MALGLDANDPMNLLELDKEFTTNLREHELNAQIQSSIDVELSEDNPKIELLRSQEHECQTYEYSTISATCVLS